jgi:3-methyl-2-oxobutanoate hydroxymethyltransferase
MGDWVPPFAEQFADVQSEMDKGVEQFKQHVEDESFPQEEHYVEENVEGFN